VIDRLTEIGRCYGMETNVEKTKALRIARQPSPRQIIIDQKQAQNVEYFNCLMGMITNDPECTRGIKYCLSMAKAAFNKKKAVFTSKLDLNLRKKLEKYKILNIALYAAEIWTVRKVDRKYLESCEM
jgi:hypothetical protein